MKKTISIFIICVIASQLRAQSGTLDSYVEEGLQNNLALRQKEVNYLKSQQVLKQARALFYPDISLNARYTVAEGGRIIEFPVGSMLNPVYQSLNLLLGSPVFEDQENQEFSFYRPSEHETRLHLVQPVIDSRLIYNMRINREFSQVNRADAETYSRQLVAEIKTAYFNYLKTVKLLELLNETRPLLQENIRVNESLFKNEKVTIDNVYRSRAELSKFEGEYAEVMKAHQVTRAYFNFLLNRPLESGILADSEPGSNFPAESLEQLTNQAIGSREELQMLESYTRIAENNLSLTRGNALPNLYAAIDYGFQGTKYEFNPDQDYMLASLVLRWNLSHGFDNKARISEARIERDIRLTRLEEAEQQIRLQIIEAYYAILAAEESITAASEELSSAGKAFRVIERKYGEGQASLIEFIDARTSMTRAEQRLIISRYDHQIRYSELERVACLYDISKN